MGAIYSDSLLDAIGSISLMLNKPRRTNLKLDVEIVSMLRDIQTLLEYSIVLPYG